MAYAHAAESLLGLWPEPGLARARTVLLELERLYNHLNDIGAVCAGVGFAAGSMAFAALKERAQRLNRALTGHRFLFDTVAVGGSTWQVSRGRRRRGPPRAASPWRTTPGRPGTRCSSTLGPGPVRRRRASSLPRRRGALGVVGPAARAAGDAVDARTDSPRLAYPGFAPAVPHSASGDVASRVNVRALEVEVTLRMLDELLGGGVEPAGTVPGPADPVGVASVESPRGETVCVLEAEDGRVARLHLRTASFANWPARGQGHGGRDPHRLPGDQQELRALLLLLRPVAPRGGARVRLTERIAQNPPPDRPCGPPPSRGRWPSATSTRARATGASMSWAPGSARTTTWAVTVSA